jgi:hypothetical protein
MSDNIDAVEHQKHATAIAELKTENIGIKESLSEVKGSVRDVAANVDKVVALIQSNTASNKPNIGLLVTCGGLILSAGLGFMTLVILPMQEDTDKKRIEQGDRNKLQDIINARTSRESGQHEVSERHYDGWLMVNAGELKKLHDVVSVHAIKEAQAYGELKGRLDCIENQVNAIDYTGPRRSTK